MGRGIVFIVGVFLMRWCFIVNRMALDFSLVIIVERKKKAEDEDEEEDEDDGKKEEEERRGMKKLLGFWEGDCLLNSSEFIHLVLRLGRLVQGFLQ